MVLVAAVLVREVTEEQKVADRAAVLDSPAFATVLDFFEVAPATPGPRSHAFLRRSCIAGYCDKILASKAADSPMRPTRTCSWNRLGFSLCRWARPAILACR